MYMTILPLTFILATTLIGSIDDLSTLGVQIDGPLIEVTTTTSNPDPVEATYTVTSSDVVVYGGPPIGEIPVATEQSGGLYSFYWKVWKNNTLLYSGHLPWETLEGGIQVVEGDQIKLWLKYDPPTGGLGAAPDQIGSARLFLGN